MHDRHGARRHWEDALRLYTDLGVPDADSVRAQLAALSPDRGSVHRAPA
ncbi:hypothetical protein [Streptomyces poonensis]|nr:hypothetical protein [Streptomyces poonensis]